MKRLSYILVFCCFCGLLSAQSTPTPVDYVNPMTGTLSKFELSTGNNYPVISLPWGMNCWSPQTGNMGNGWMYTYTADKIVGFKQTHQPSPWMNDYGQFSLMPVAGKTVFDQHERASWFSHKAEKAMPYYYRVYLADYDITTEITPTSRAACFRFTFPDNEQSSVVVDAFDRGSYVKVLPDRQAVVGYTTRNSGGVPANFRNYFVIRFDRPFDDCVVAKGKTLHHGPTESLDNHAGAVICFRTCKGEQVHAHVASSFISEEQAWQNLKEVEGRSFDEIVAAGRQAWNDVLGRIEVEGGSETQLRTFYSCLWRSLQFPRAFYEETSTGQIVHYSPYNGRVEKGYLFADTGFWDTFRALFPFLNLAFPSVNERMQEGLVNAYRESGFLPEWSSPGHRDCMIGQNSASVVADAWLKGLRGYEIEDLWKAVTYGAHHELKNTASGRRGAEWYDKLGYVPRNIGLGQSAARTLEYAFNDWSIYRLGRSLGKSEAELLPYKKNALNYRHVFHPERKLMCGRDTEGRFNPAFGPEDWSEDFCEGNSWHWSFCVFHDPKGLIELMGGRESFCQMIDSVFALPSYLGMKSRDMIHEMREMQVMDMGQYAHGNQPIQHMVYMYDWGGQPWKAQYWVREIMDKLYNPNADAYCGDEDNGQTSAWYIFSAMGFYPVCPGSGQYALGSPLFRKVTLRLENGKQIEIQSPTNAPERRYVKSVKLNGKAIGRNYLMHDELVKGARLTFEMDSTPNMSRGIREEEAPYSFSDEKE